ncbi:MAG: hypothetical protein NC930_07560 [Candidatus Omnitrophica bacterium]|nr:hypothetical protein [Candidatus Omnitrophota bacterium]
MHKAYWVGTKQKYRVDFRVIWWAGLATIACDGKVIFRRLFLFKFSHVLEIGEDGKHIIDIRYNLFDRFQDIFYITIDGQKPLPEMEIHTPEEIRVDTPADDAAAALIFVGTVNIIFSVIGTLFVPELDALTARLLLLLAGVIYILFAVQTTVYQQGALMIGTLFFVVDSVVELILDFSAGGLVVRTLILYYLILGIRYLGILRAQSKI